VHVPTVRAGDVLRVRSCTVDEIPIGEIAVFRKSQYLLAHRVIGKRSENGRRCVVTRPDGVNEGTDSPTFDDGLLGVVTSITRNGKPVSLQPTSYPWPAQRYFAIRLALMHAAWPWQSRFENFCSRARQWPPLRFAADWWLRLRRPRISYTVRLPLPAFGDAVYHRVAFEAFDLQKGFRGRPIDRWTLAMHVNEQSEPTATVTLARDASETWRIAGRWLSPRYRGSFPSDTMMRKLNTILPASPPWPALGPAGRAADIGSQNAADLPPPRNVRS